MVRRVRRRQRFHQTTLDEQIDIAANRFRVFTSASTYYTVRDMDTGLELFLTSSREKADEIAAKLKSGDIRLDEDGCVARESTTA